MFDQINAVLIIIRDIFQILIIPIFWYAVFKTKLLLDKAAHLFYRTRPCIQKQVDRVHYI